MRRSVEYAFAERAASLPFVRANAQEMSEDVMYQHIDLYVNDYSVDLGAEGRRAVEVLFERAKSVARDPAGRPPVCSSAVSGRRRSLCATVLMMWVKLPDAFGQRCRTRLQDVGGLDLVDVSVANRRHGAPSCRAARSSPRRTALPHHDAMITSG